MLFDFIHTFLYKKRFIRVLLRRNLNKLYLFNFLVFNTTKKVKFEQKFVKFEQKFVKFDLVPRSHSSNTYKLKFNKEDWITQF